MHLTTYLGHVRVNLGYNNIKIDFKYWTPTTGFVWSIMGIEGRDFVHTVMKIEFP
jgi:hypothetical protein